MAGEQGHAGGCARHIAARCRVGTENSSEKSGAPLSRASNQCPQRVLMMRKERMVAHHSENLEAAPSERGVSSGET